jgi:hypothetical protein
LRDLQRATFWGETCINQGAANPQQIQPLINSLRLQCPDQDATTPGATTTMPIFTTPILTTPDLPTTQPPPPLTTTTTLPGQTIPIEFPTPPNIDFCFPQSYSLEDAVCSLLENVQRLDARVTVLENRNRGEKLEIIGVNAVERDEEQGSLDENEELKIKVQNMEEQILTLITRNEFLEHEVYQLKNMLEKHSEILEKLVQKN